MIMEDIKNAVILVGIMMALFHPIGGKEFSLFLKRHRGAMETFIMTGNSGRGGLKGCDLVVSDKITDAHWVSSSPRFVMSINALDSFEVRRPCKVMGR